VDVERVDELKVALASTDEEERRGAVQAMAACPFAAIRPLALSALGDESWRVRKEAVALLLSQSVTDDLTDDLIGLLTASGNVGLRNSVVEVLQAMGRHVLPRLIAFLDHEDAGVRKFVVDIMGGIGEAEAVSVLAAMLSDVDPNVAAAAAESLGKIGDRNALPALLAALGRDDLQIRFAILDALGRIGVPVPVGMIIPLAREPLLRKSLFDCLGTLGDVTAVPHLTDGLRDRARTVRESALLALDAIRQRVPAGLAAENVTPYIRSLSGSDLVEHLLSLLESPSRRIKAAAVSMLGLVGDLRALASLVREYGDESVRLEALQAIRDLGPEAGEKMAGIYAQADDERRSLVVHLAGELCYDSSTRIVSQAMTDPVPMVRALAAEAVGKTSASALVPGLVQMLDDAHQAVRRAATGALIHLAPAVRPQVAAAAGTLALSEQHDRRLQAVRLFAALDDAGQLVLLSKDEHPLDRREALTLLGELHHPDTAGLFALAMADEDPDVRVAAAHTLGTVGGMDGVQSLLLALDDPSPRVQVAALKSLGRRRETSAMKRIVSLLEGADGMILITALQTLVQIGGAAAVPFLKQAQGHDDTEVVRVATGLLDELTGRAR
jgi:HEAT repeat protein